MKLPAKVAQEEAALAGGRNLPVAHRRLPILTLLGGLFYQPS